MGQGRVRYTLYSNIQIGLAVAMTLIGLVTLHYINLAGDGGALFHLVISLSFAVVVWFCFRLAQLGAWASREGIVLGELFTETTVPFRLVLAVNQGHGLALVVSGGRRLRVPGFEGSMIGDLRGYPAVYGRARSALERELERAWERTEPDTAAEVSSKTRLQLWVLLTLTAIFFVFAQVNQYLVVPAG